MNGTQHRVDLLPTVPEQAAIGYLHLSFEYNKTDLRIRVWQVSDLLLPPPQTSMIESIYVKSYLIPDAQKKTNRQTEEVKVEPANKDSNINSHAPENGIQYIFTSSSFRFDTPLIYLGVTQDIIDQRSLQLEVCMTQKRTHKTFLMAMVHLPLSTAVRRPLREKYSLIPCMNHTIPNSMRVYSARDLMLQNSSSMSWLNKALSRSNSIQITNGSSTDNQDNEDIDNLIRRFASVSSDDSDGCDDGVGSSIGVKSSLGRSFTSVNADEASASSDEDGSSGRMRTSSSNSTPEHPQNAVKKKIIPNELLDKTSSSDGETTEFQRVPYIRQVSGKFTVIRVDEPLTEGGDTPSSPKTPTETLANQDTKPETLVTPSGKKKIIPNEFFSKKLKNSEKAEEIINNSTETKSESHEKSDIEQHTVLSSNLKPQDNTGYARSKSESTDEPELSRLRVYSNSEASSEVGSTPGSRPETPVWDFYDFTDDTDSKADAPVPEDDAAKALGTLQASLLKLSRNPQVLDTCRVVGPVLPTVMLDDFELDEDNEEVDASDIQNLKENMEETNVQSEI
ncbi:uncharacterized protein LOC131932736 isoform X2 [Physella acuta]|nr:uncharacterized protein LOC131932736 isoform X2 [Physella acuta]